MIEKVASGKVKVPIYMDTHHAGRFRVVEAMLPYFTEDFGNAASRATSFGWKRRRRRSRSPATRSRR